jgi:hypothetical protein
MRPRDIKGFLGKIIKTGHNLTPLTCAYPFMREPESSRYNWIPAFARVAALADFYKMTIIILKITGDDLE